MYQRLQLWLNPVDRVEVDRAEVVLDGVRVGGGVVHMSSRFWDLLNMRRWRM